MAESLRRLVNIASFSILQEKLEKWLDDYHANTCDQNAARCCEIIELNARVQSQLFKLLSLSANEGGLYGGASVIKSRLLPWLGQGFIAASGLSSDTSLSVLAEAASKDREINDLQDMYERSLQTMEDDLTQTRAQAEDLKLELADTKEELNSQQRQSVSEKMFTETEVADLRRKLRFAEEEVDSMRARSGLVDGYERQIRRLKDDIAILTGRRDTLMNGDAQEMKPRRPRSRPSSPFSRPSSPFALEDVTQRVRQQNLITRYNDMFAQDRLDAMDTLRRYSDDHENNQRVLYTAMEEAFTAAKLAFTSFKMKVRSTLAISHLGPETLEEAVQDYINRNVDLYDLPGLVSDVIRALNRNPKIFLPPEVSYTVIQPFIREACKLAWNMSALAQPMDVVIGVDAELFSDTRYRRSYDSEYSAPLVNHHIWPCLMQGSRTIMKGEVCTRRGASMGSRRSRSPARSRSSSPIRSYSPLRSPSRGRSRSPSPRRLDSSLSFRPTSRSSSPGRAMTASTSLSNYGVVS